MKINVTFDFTDDDIKNYIIDTTKESENFVLNTSKKEFNKALREEIKDYIVNTVNNYLWSGEMGALIQENLLEKKYC